MQKPFFQAGSTQVSIITIILTIPIFYIAAWVSRRLKIIFDTKLLTRVTIEKSLKFTISSLVRYSILAIFLIIGLSVIGIDLSSIAVFFGVLGIGVGFGLQNVVANMFAGIVIIFERPIKEGDRILVNGIEGDIIKIKLRSTIIKTLTNENIIIPNSKLIDQNLHNYSFGNPEIIICNSIQVSYQTDLDKSSKILLQVAEKNPYILANKDPKTRIIAFENSGILLELRTWIKNAQNKLEALSWTNMQIWKAFKEHDITIPFPQLDLHVKDSKLRINMVKTKK